MESAVEDIPAVLTLDDVSNEIAESIFDLVKDFRDFCDENADTNDDPELVDMEVLETLLEIHNVEYFRARGASKRKNAAQLFAELGKLDEIVGANASSEIIQHGEFLDYKPKTLERYFELARIVAGRFNYEIAKENCAHFYSITSLAQVIGNNCCDACEDTQLPESFSIRQYTLLHRDNAQSQQYLASLLEKGCVSVDRKEHWTKSDKGSDGARGGNILKKIGHQLILIFSELGLPNPKLKFPPQAHKMYISQETQKNLKWICDKLYA